MELELRNVGIIRSANLTFTQGLNLIVGSSSSGKSTLLRAIRNMMDNSFNDGNISYGERKMAIKIVNDGHTATYIRDLDNPQRKSAYQIDGKVYTKIGRSSLDDISSLFKLCPVEIDGEKINFNFSAQFSGPFLLLGSSSLLYSILTYRSSFDITKINDLYNTDMKKAKQDINVLLKTKEGIEKEYSDKRKQIEFFTGIENAYTEMQDIRQKYFVLKKEKEVYNLYKEILVKRESCIKRLNEISHITEVFSGYSERLDVVSLLHRYKDSKNILSYTRERIDRAILTLSNIDVLLSNYDSFSLLKNYICLKKKVLKNKHILVNANIPDSNQIVLLHKYVSLTRDILSTRDKCSKYTESIQSVENILCSVKVCPLCKQPIINCSH